MNRFAIAAGTIVLLFFALAALHHNEIVIRDMKMERARVNQIQSM
jgi:hypothetical protein